METQGTQGIDSAFIGIDLRTPVIDMGTESQDLSGIYTPGYQKQEVDRHIHAQFQEDYQAFLRPFPLNRQAIDHWKELISSAIAQAGRIVQPDATILDIGSGGGTSIFPLIELFPDVSVIASDLSVNLLREIKKWYAEHYPHHRGLRLLQLNAENTVFSDNQLDLITGAHILHHLADLQKAFVEFNRILKLGGFAVFWEPFESGSQLLSLIMQILITKNSTSRIRGKIPKEVLDCFHIFMSDLHRRKGSFKEKGLLDAIDDKWTFTRAQLLSALKGTGLELVSILQIYGAEGLIVLMLDHELKRRMLRFNVLPAWAQDTVREIEGQFSLEFISENLFSGAIILAKS
jgi:ubiquinone/menaquinone biosynthesis C-methylase UbiE